MGASSCRNRAWSSPLIQPVCSRGLHSFLPQKSIVVRLCSTPAGKATETEAGPEAGPLQPRALWRPHCPWGCCLLSATPALASCGVFLISFMYIHSFIHLY